MEFTAFLDLLPKIMKTPLPGPSAHEAMAPLERVRLLRDFDPETANPKRAGVMMLVYPKNGAAHLALTVRNEYPGVHSAQVSFPGGKREQGDAGFRQTALRETFEEIGVPPEAITVVRGFSPLYIPPSNFMVYPFLGFCDARPEFITDPAEVARLLEVPLATLLDENTAVVRQMATSYNPSIDVPGFWIEGRLVWGATAMMLSELNETLRQARQADGFS